MSEKWPAHDENRARIFEVPRDDTPLPPVRRTHLEWDGDAWVEIDVRTGRVVDSGRIEREDRDAA